MSNLSKTVLSAAAVCMVGGPSLSAHAKTVRNPLYDFAGEKAEICSYTKDESEVGAVSKKTILTTLLKRYSLSWNYEVFLQRQEKKDVTQQQTSLASLDLGALVAGKIAPCYDPVRAFATLDKQGCRSMTNGLPEYYRAAHLRFKGKDTELAMRRAILRLFEAVNTGIVEGLYVKPVEWKAPYPGKAGETIYASQYRPLVDPLIDDIVIGRFLTGQPSFEIRCAEVTKKPASGTSAAEQPVEWQPATLATTVLEAPSGDTIDFKAPSPENKLLLVSAGQAILSAQAGGEKMGGTGKLRFLKTIDDFAKSQSDASGAEFGLVDTSELKGGNDKSDDGILANLVLGYQLSWQTPSESDLKKAKKLKKQWSDFSIKKQTLTPYFRLSQKPTDEVIPNLANPGETTKREIAYAEYGVGLRYVRSSEMEEQRDNINMNNIGERTSLYGTRRPGHAYGVTFEYLTDNYQQLKVWRFGGDFTPSNFLHLPAFRQRQDIYMAGRGEWARGNRESHSLGFRHMLTGWSALWDVKAQLDYLDFDQRALDFSTVIADDRTGDGDGIYYGTRGEFKLLKTGLFGIGPDTPILEFVGDFNHMVSEKSDEGATKYSLGFTLQHPELKAFNVGLKYFKGREYITRDTNRGLTLTFSGKL